MSAGKDKTERIKTYLDKLELDKETRKEAINAWDERIAKEKEAKEKEAKEKEAKDKGATVLDSVGEEVLVKLAGKFIGQNDRERLTKLLELIDELDKPEPGKKSKEDSFLRNNKMCGTKIDGNDCIEMISNCLFSKDASACITKWNSVDWSNEIDVANMDGELAYELATKIGLVNSSVADLIKAETIPKLNGSTLAVLNAIKKRISPNHNDKPIIGETYGVQARLPTIVIAASQMGGGVNTQLLRANIIRKFDNLNINLSMNGGYYHTSATVFRSNLEELSLLLEKQDREIDSNDKKELLKMIGSLERTEIRISKASKYIDFLTKAIKAGKIDIVAETKKGKIVTAKILEDLYVKHEESTKAGQKKVMSLMGVLTGLEKMVTKDDLDSMKKDILGKISSAPVGAAASDAAAHVKMLEEKLAFSRDKAARAEAARVDAENARVDAENARADAENARDAAENYARAAAARVAPPRAEAFSVDPPRARAAAARVAPLASPPAAARAPPLASSAAPPLASPAAPPLASPPAAAAAAAAADVRAAIAAAAVVRPPAAVRPRDDDNVQEI